MSGPTRKYTDLTLDARRIYDGVVRKERLLGQLRRPIYSSVLRRKDTPPEERARAEQRLDRLTRAQERLREYRRMLLGYPQTWSEAGVPVVVGGVTRVYRVPSRLWGVQFQDNTGPVNLDAFPEDADALVRTIRAMVEHSERELVEAQERARLDARATKARRDARAHWKDNDPNPEPKGD